MPLLQSIVEEFDRELARLHALRSIVAGLSRTSEAVARLISFPTSPADLPTPAAPAATQAEERPGPLRKARADKGKPRESRAHAPQTIKRARAFAATIPSGPVVFNPTRLAEEKNQREQSRQAQTTAEPVEAAEDLEALSRSLAARWSTGLVQ